MTTKDSTRRTLATLAGPISDEQWRRICAVPAARIREVRAAAAPARRSSTCQPPRRPEARPEAGYEVRPEVRPEARPEAGYEADYEDGYEARYEARYAALM